MIEAAADTDVLTCDIHQSFGSSLDQLGYKILCGTNWNWSTGTKPEETLFWVFPPNTTMMKHRQLLCQAVFLFIARTWAFPTNSPTHWFTSMEFQSKKEQSTQQLHLKTTNVTALISRSLEYLTKSGQSQIFIGIAGAPGSGKSSFGQKFVDSINKIKNDTAFSILIPMDGYHYSQAQLRNLGERGIRIGDSEATSGETTTYEDLMKRRGAPWTFDSTKLYEDLRETKSRCFGSFPLYDRTISDPVPEQIHVTMECKVIVCEGNYLLAFNDPSWKPLQNIWDDTWLIDVPENILKERLVRRHLQNWSPVKEARFGIGRIGAIAKVESSDLKHAAYVYQNSRQHANVIIQNA
jgi:pantothenate kinase